MKEARILHIEDTDVLAKLFAEVVDMYSDGRHAVVQNAYNRDQAFQALDLIHAGELAVNMVVTDGNIGSGDIKDGHDIATRIEELELPVWVIAMSTHDLRESGAKYHAVLRKGDYTHEDVVGMLDGLPEFDPDLAVVPTNVSGGFSVVPRA